MHKLLARQLQRALGLDGGDALVRLAELSQLQEGDRLSAGQSALLLAWRPWSSASMAPTSTTSATWT